MSRAATGTSIEDKKMFGEFSLLSFNTIQTKFLAIVVPLVLLSTIAVFGLFEFNARRDANLELQDKLDKLVAIQSAVVAEPLWNVADEQIKLILAALAIDPDVDSAAVYDERDQLVGVTGSADEIETRSFFASKEIVYVDDDETGVAIGRLAVSLTDARLQSAAEERMFLAGGLAAILLVSVVVSALLGNRRTIGIPLERLLGSINRSREGGQRQAVDWRSNDEIGAVVSAFNEMQDRQEAYEADLRNARDTLEQRVEDRTAELKKHQVQLRAIIENMTEGLVCFGPDQRLILCNSTYRDFYGYSEEDVAANPHFEDLMRLDKERGTILDDGSYEEQRSAYRHEPVGTFLLQLSDGRWLLARERTTSVGTVSIQTDITERKRAEEALRKSEATFKAVVDQLPAALNLKDAKSRYTLVNRTWHEWYVEEGQEWVGLTTSDVNPKELAEGFMAIDRQVMETGESVTQEITAPFADGSAHTLVMSKFPIRDTDGTTIAVGTVETDITERKLAEEALAKKEAQLRIALENMPGGMRLVDKDQNNVLFNSRYLELYDLPDGLLKVGESKRVENLYEARRGDFGPGDPEALTDEWLAAWPVQTETTSWEETPVGGKILQVDTSPTPDGGVVNVVTDITKRRQAEKALEEAYEVIKHQNERMEGELNAAKEIQMSMLPLTFPPFPERSEFSVFATLAPAREVGGDLYDFFFIDEDRFCFCVGDVSGKGVPAALFMAVSKSLIKSRAANDLSPASIVTHVNNELGRDNDTSMFVTLFLGILDVKTGALTYTNAGHNPPYLLQEDGSVIQLDQLHGPVVAAMEGMVYGEDKRTVMPGDLLLMYTDGVTEAMDVNEKLYSGERLTSLLSSRQFESVEEIVDVTVSDVWNHQGDAEQADDVTVLAVRFFGEPEGKALQVLELDIKNRPEEIAEVKAAFDAFSDQYSVPAAMRSEMKVVFDELLGNIVSHGYRDDSDHTIEIRVKLSTDRLAVTITDDGIPFNPFTSVSPITATTSERGIQKIRSMVDDVSYRRRIDKNVVLLVKHLEAGS